MVHPDDLNLIAHKLERIPHFRDGFEMINHETGHRGVVDLVVINLVAVNHIGEHIDGRVALHQHGMVVALGNVGFHNFLFFRHIPDNILDNVVQGDNTGQIAELVNHDTKIVLFLAEFVQYVLRVRVFGAMKKSLIFSTPR